MTIAKRAKELPLVAEIRSHCHGPEVCDCWLCVLLRQSADLLTAQSAEVIRLAAECERLTLGFRADQAQIEKLIIDGTHEYERAEAAERKLAEIAAMEPDTHWQDGSFMWIEYAADVKAHAAIAQAQEPAK